MVINHMDGAMHRQFAPRSDPNVVDGKVKTGNKYMIQPKKAASTLFAGIYRIEDGFPHFAILTREPGSEIRFIHDRKPVILDAQDAARWIRPETLKEEIRLITARALTDMVFEQVE